MAEKVVIAGGSGFIGQALSIAFGSAGFAVTILSRRHLAHCSFPYVEWDGRTIGPWVSEVDGADAIVNLSGEPIAQKWTLNAQTRIIQSRVAATTVIGEAIRLCDAPPRVWINASAIGFYGDRGDEVLDEESNAGSDSDFLVKTSLSWERGLLDADTPSTRKTSLRVGFALGRRGGAFPKLVKLSKWFLGGQVGDGNQWVSWIHVDDLARLFVWAVQESSSSVINGTAPEPVKNAEFMERIRRSVRRPWSPPVPAFALMLASAFGAPDPTLLLTSQRAQPVAALSGGFEFAFPSLELALDDLL